MIPVSSAWLEALTLEERLALLLATPDIHSDGSPELGAHRLKRWRTKTGLEKDSLFQQRLGPYRADDLVLVLTESVDILAKRVGPPPSWLRDLLNVLSQTAPPTENWRQLVSSSSSSVFTEVVESLITHHLARLESAVTERDLYSFFSPGEALLGPLIGRLGFYLCRVMAQELHKMREAGKLMGDTPEARFNIFIRRLSEPGVRAQLLMEYPVLARQCLIACQNWYDSSIEFLERMATDIAELRSIFGAEPPITSLQGGMGDPHSNGRQVLMAEFHNGVRVIYKPHSLAIERGFQEFVRWLNGRGLQPGLKALTMLDRGAYGWVEFVAHRYSSSEAEVESFYRRQGIWLALLYCLAATDIHGENVIAHAEHPVPIDLEAILHPQLKTPIDNAQMQAWATLKDSLLSVGLVPMPLGDDEAFDISGVGGINEQRYPMEMPSMENPGTDNFRIVRTRHKVVPMQNMTTRDGHGKISGSWKESLIAGFTSTYSLLQDHQEELLSSTGPLSLFTGARVRAIIRSSQRYGALLADSLHPDFLRSALPRDMFFDNLWIEAAQIPSLSSLIPLEQRQLWAGDIPYFSCTTESPDILTPGGAPIPRPDFKSGMEIARNRLKRMGPNDLNLQTWFLRGSLASLPGPDPFADMEPHPPRSLFEHAQTIRTRLADTAIKCGDTASWLTYGVSVTGYDPAGHTPRYEFGVAGSDMYGGLPGIIFFLASVDDQLAPAACRMLDKQIETQGVHGVGAFGGWGGILYTWAHLGVRWGRPDFLDRAVDVLPSLHGNIDTDRQFDIIGGTAGCILALLALHRARADSRVLETAVRCGEHLLRAGESGPEGMRWKLDIRRGLSHGAGGLGWALVALAKATAAPRFLEAGLQAFRWEDLMLADGRWTDFQGEGEEPAATWCHGAHGIALTRLLAWEMTGELWLLDTARLALSQVEMLPQLSSHILCHGALGNFEPLLLAGRLLPDEERWKSELARRMDVLKEDLDSRGWRMGLPAEMETPGLMTGLAGIGYGLLRLCAPVGVPSVLMLEPPAPV